MEACSWKNETRAVVAGWLREHDEEVAAMLDERGTIIPIVRIDTRREIVSLPLGIGLGEIWGGTIDIDPRAEGCPLLAAVADRHRRRSEQS